MLLHSGESSVTHLCVCCPCSCCSLLSAGVEASGLLCTQQGSVPPWRAAPCMWAEAAQDASLTRGAERCPCEQKTCCLSLCVVGRRLPAAGGWACSTVPGCKPQQLVCQGKILHCVAWRQAFKQQLKWLSSLSIRKQWCFFFFFSQSLPSLGHPVTSSLVPAERSSTGMRNF